MKSKQLYVSLVATAAIFANAASAEESNYKPYVGLDISKITADYKSFDGVSGADFFADSFTGINPYVGIELNDSVALEAGYLKTGSKGKDFDTLGLTGDTNLKITGFHFDVVGKYAAADKLDILGSVGLARLKADASVNLTAGVNSISGQGDETDTAVRLGVGAEYALTDKVGVRGMLRYMKVDFSDVTDNLMQYSVGVNYKF